MRGPAVELAEIVIQGLRGFPQMWQAPIGAGVTVAQPLRGHEGALLEVVCALLYPPATGDDDRLTALVDPAAEPVRIGILVKGRDGHSYRILRDVKAGRYSMLREEQTGFVPITTQPAEAAQLVTAVLGFPPEDSFRSIFSTRRQELPSQRTDALGGPPPLPADASGPNRRPSPADQAGYEFSHLDEQGRRAKLADIETTLAHNDRVRELEHEVDLMQRELFELDERLGPVGEQQRALDQALKALEPFEHIAAIPDDFLSQVQAIERSLEAGRRDVKRTETETRTAQELLDREVYHAQTPRDHLTAAFRLPLVLYGSAVGVGGILLGVLGALFFESLRYAALLDIPGFAAAIFGAWHYLDGVEGTGHLRYRVERLKDDHLAKVAQLRRDEAALEELFAPTGYPKEQVLRLEQLLLERAAARQTIEAAKAELATLHRDPAVKDASQGREALAKRLAEAEERLFASGGYMGDGAQLRNDAELLRATLEGRAPQLPDDRLSGRSLLAPGPAAPALPAAYDPTPALVRHAADLLATDLDGACQRLAPRVSQYLSGLSDRRYGQAIFGPQGELALIEVASGRSIPFTQLTPGDKDIAYLALKLTVVESAVRTARLPIFLERALESFPEIKDPLLARMIQFLGTLTQVILLTNKASLAQISEQRLVIE
ncbi:MAG: hypothetical protein ACO3JL_12330 [Myxococcota bacterium]